MRFTTLLDKININLNELEERIDDNFENRNNAIHYFLENIRGNVGSIMSHSNNYRKKEWFYSIFSRHKASEIYGTTYVSMNNLNDNLKKLVFSLYGSEEVINEAKIDSEKQGHDLGLSYSKHSIKKRFEKSLRVRNEKGDLEEKINEVLNNEAGNFFRQVRNKTSHVGINDLLEYKGNGLKLYIAAPYMFEGENAREILESEVNKYLSLTNDCLETIVNDNSNFGLVERSKDDKIQNKKQLNEEKYFRAIKKLIEGAFLFGAISIAAYGINQINTERRNISEDILFKELVGVAYEESSSKSEISITKAKFDKIKLRLMERREEIDLMDDGINHVLNQWEIPKKYTEASDFGDLLNSFYGKQSKYIDELPNLSFNGNSPTEIFHSIGELEKMIRIERELRKLNNEVMKAILIVSGRMR